MQLISLHRYPIKACQGHDLLESPVDALGLSGDRRWMIVGPDGRFITQREVPALALIRPETVATGLILHHDDAPSLPVPVPMPNAEVTPVQVWRSALTAPLAIDDAHHWLTARIGQDCRLVYMPDNLVRDVNPAYGRPNDRVSFADGYPILLTTQASLDALNERLDTPVPMDRFRPNLVVDGLAAFAEESWRQITLGNVHFDIVKPCERCVVTTTDQSTGLRMGADPLRTLARWRGADRVHFGMNLIPRSLGTVRVGAAVTVLA